MSAERAAYPNLFGTQWAKEFRKPKYRVNNINRFLAYDISEGDTVIQDNAGDDTEDRTKWSMKSKARCFTVEKFFPHHILLRSEYGYYTSVSYLDLFENFHKKDSQRLKEL
jgi:hypothetical protein